MTKILVFSELVAKDSTKALKKSALELLSAAQSAGAEVDMLVLDPKGAAVQSVAGSYGVKRLHIADDARLENYNPQMYTETMAALLGREKYDLILAASSTLGRDLFPRLAARIDAATISDCTELQLSGGNVRVRRPMYAGKCTVGVQFTDPSKTKIVLMRPNQLTVAAGQASGPAEVVKLEVPAMDLKTIVQNVVKGATEKLDLTEANIIVSGGRGLKEAGNFKLLEDLASVLGATVGASRAVVDAGWVPHSMQVGQTGKTVAPSLYIACGISGAIQHLAGMSGSKVIVAINKDPNAPIFQKATYGIVGDLFEIVPKLTEEFKKVLHA